MSEQRQVWSWVEIGAVRLSAPDLEVPFTYEVIWANRENKVLSVEVRFIPMPMPTQGYYQLEFIYRPNTMGKESDRYVVKLTDINFPSMNTFEMIFEDMGYV